MMQEQKSDRQKLKDLGLDYIKLGRFFGYKPGSFENSTRRELIEKGVLRVVEHIQEGGKNKNGDNPQEPSTGTEPA